MIAEEAKQNHKIWTKVNLRTGTTGCTEWLNGSTQLSSYALRFAERGVTGEQLLRIFSDEALMELGVDSEVDRKYMLLQLARVRDHQSAQALLRAELEDETIHELDVSPGKPRWGVARVFPRSQRQRGETEKGSTKPWAVVYRSGERHRYTSKQMREKFGLTEIHAGMSVNHHHRGRGTVIGARKSRSPSQLALCSALQQNPRIQRGTIEMRPLSEIAETEGNIIL